MLTACIRLLSATLMFCGCVVVVGEGGGGGWASGHLCDFSPGVVTVTTTSPPNCHAITFMPTLVPVVLDRHAWCRVAPLPSPLARPRTARWVSHTWFVDKALCDPDGWQYAVQFPDADVDSSIQRILYIYSVSPYRTDRLTDQSVSLICMSFRHWEMN